MATTGKPGQAVEVVALAADVHQMQRAARAQDTEDFPQRGDAQVGLEAVEHQRREHAVEAAVRVREFVGNAAIELECQTGAPCLTAGAGERLGIGIQPDDLEYARDLGLGLKLIGTAARVGDDGLSISVYPAFLYPGHPLASVNGPFNAVTVESEAITEITMSGPGAGGPQTATAVLGDVISAMIPPASTPPAIESLRIVSDVVASFYLHLEVADQPGVLAQVAQVLAQHGVSVKSVVQKGLRDQARLVMVVHPVLESRFAAAMEEIGALSILRAPPRAIRVIEEEFG